MLLMPAPKKAAEILSGILHHSHLHNGSATRRCFDWLEAYEPLVETLHEKVVSTERRAFGPWQRGGDLFALLPVGTENRNLLRTRRVPWHQHYVQRQEVAERVPSNSQSTPNPNLYIKPQCAYAVSQFRFGKSVPVHWLCYSPQSMCAWVMGLDVSEVNMRGTPLSLDYLALVAQSQKQKWQQSCIGVCDFYLFDLRQNIRFVEAKHARTWRRLKPLALERNASKRVENNNTRAFGTFSSCGVPDLG